MYAWKPCRRHSNDKVAILTVSPANKLVCDSYLISGLLGGRPIGNSPGGYMAGLGEKCEEWYQHVPPMKYEKHFLPLTGNNTKVTIPDWRTKLSLWIVIWLLRYKTTNPWRQQLFFCWFGHTCPKNCYTSWDCNWWQFHVPHEHIAHPFHQHGHVCLGVGLLLWCISQKPVPSPPCPDNGRFDRFEWDGFGPVVPCERR